MKNWESLNAYQRKLAEGNMSLVGEVIYFNINTCGNIPGLGYDDVYQEGCLWLCHAAATYIAETANFKTYARKVIKNGLVSYCKRMQAKQSKIVYLDDPMDDRLAALSWRATIPAKQEWLNSEERADIRMLLDSRPYGGAAHDGIKALQLIIDGLSISEIAAIYGVKPKRVMMWVLRVTTKLKQDKRFTDVI